MITASLGMVTGFSLDTLRLNLARETGINLRKSTSDTSFGCVARLVWESMRDSSGCGVSDLRQIKDGKSGRDVTSVSGPDLTVNTTA